MFDNGRELRRPCAFATMMAACLIAGIFAVRMLPGASRGTHSFQNDPLQIGYGMHKKSSLSLHRMIIQDQVDRNDEADPAIDNDATSELPNIDRALLSFLSQSSFARDRVIDLMVNEYTSSLSPDKEMSDRLDNAIGVLELWETDGEPIQVKGHPYLFVGSAGASMNEESLHKNGITHVVNWSTTARCNVFDDIEYLCITGVRGPLMPLDALDKAVAFVESARKKGGRIMSHCWYGKNRSVTLLVAYLMKHDEMTILQALNLLRETRPQADPYREALQAYSKYYLDTSQSGNV